MPDARSDETHDERRLERGPPERSRGPGTGLFSVAQIQHILRIEFGRAQRYGFPIACLVVAIDRLEPLRDAHGYEAKEEAVAAVVALLREATRASDFLGRTADDRLVGVVPHTGSAGARTLAARLLESARESRLERAQAAPITLSIGIAAADGRTSMFHDALLAAAEDALAQAVAAGGDRSVERVAPEPGA
jgi:diguanylate cyclase (GGDEF)-like protein